MRKSGNILVTGGSGMVGSLVNFGIRLNHKDLDICSTESIKKAYKKYRPSTVLHLAALDINTCEQYPDKAYEVNTIGTFNVATACRKNKIKMVYMSTCILFDGTKKTPYHEDDTPNPIHVYGRTKRIGELITMDLNPNCLIVRPGWLFGNNKVNKGFVNICLSSLTKNKDLIVNTSNRLGSPTYIPDMLKEVKRLIDENADGVYHIANSGVASYYEIAKEVKKIGKFSAKIKQVKAKDAKPELPKRGTMEALVSKKIILRPWREALAEYLKAN